MSLGTRYLLPLVLLVWGMSSCAQILGIDDGIAARSGGGGEAGVGGLGGGGAPGGEGGAGACGDPCTGEVLWVRTYGGSYPQLVSGLVVGPGGETTIAGNFTDEITLDPPAESTNPFSSVDAYLLEVDGEGAPTWSVFLTGPNAQPVATDIARRPDGGVVISGEMSGTVTFGSASGAGGGGGANNAIVRSSIDREMYVAVADATGVPDWFTVVTTNSGDQHASAVAVSTDGNVYATGYYTGTPSIPAGTQELPNAGSGEEVLVAQLDSIGAIIWATGFSGASDDRGHDIAALSGGGVVVMGSYGMSLLAGAHSMLAAGSDDVFIARVEPSTMVPWARSVGGASLDRPGAIAVDSEDNIYVSFVFSDDFVIDELPVVGIGELNVAVLKLDADGMPLGVNVVAWVDKDADTPTLEVPCLALDRFGHIIVAGTFDGTLTLTNQETFTNIGIEDGFVVKLGQEGTIVHSTHLAGTLTSHAARASAIAVTPEGDTLVAGSVVGGVSVGGVFYTSTLGTEDIFLARFAP